MSWFQNVVKGQYHKQNTGNQRNTLKLLGAQKVFGDII
jgi:hypothetical protein